MSSTDQSAKIPPDWIREVDRGEVAELKKNDLDDLLSRAHEVRVEDTIVAGWIRILVLDARILVQEQTTRGVILVRAMPNLEDAEDLVRGRLEIYERMWDGCGCRVDYTANAGRSGSREPENRGG